MKQYFFEKLRVWQSGRVLVKNVYALTKKMPADEKFGLISQIRRAALSVTCNLAEGTSRSSGKEQARFSEIAFGGLMELLNLLITSSDLDYITESELDALRPLIEEIGNMLNKLKETQLARSG